MAIPMPFPRSAHPRAQTLAGAHAAAGARVGLSPFVAPLGLVTLALSIRIFNLLALDPFGDEVTWLRWTLDYFDPREPSSYWTPLDDEGRPPLFFWLLALTTTLDPNAFVGGRLAAALTSGATAGVLYVIGTRLFSRGVGLLAGLLWAVLPFGVLFGRLASSDDALLTLCMGLVIWASINLARRPSFASGAMCGGALALAVLSKTLGLLALAVPLCALLTLSIRPSRDKLIQSALGAFLALSVGVSPLLPWASSVLEKADGHADLEMEQRAGGGPKHDTAYRIEQNLEDTAAYYLTYLGAPLLALATGALAVGAARRERSVWFLGLALAVGVTPIVVLTTTLYSRYLLAFSLPMYVLAGLSMCRAWSLFSRGLARLQLGSWPRAAVSGAAVCLALAVFGPRLALTAAIITDPSRAQLPADDRWRYFDHRWALVGLDEHVAYLTEASKRGPITVVQPRDAPEYRFELPYDALRFYLRGAANIAFDDIPPIRGETSDRVFQTIARSQRPTYLILNDMDPDAEQSRTSPPDTYERVQRSIPTAVVAHKSARRHDGYTLTLYRTDAGAAGEEFTAARFHNAPGGRD
jgi:4-amino-4-deoxy-L-arabinose transferase-like glycosyltransferase